MKTEHIMMGGGGMSMAGPSSSSVSRYTSVPLCLNSNLNMEIITQDQDCLMMSPEIMTPTTDYFTDSEGTTGGFGSSVDDHDESDSEWEDIDEQEDSDDDDCILFQESADCQPFGTSNFQACLSEVKSICFGAAALGVTSGQNNGCKGQKIKLKAVPRFSVFIYHYLKGLRNNGSNQGPQCWGQKIAQSCKKKCKVIPPQEQERSKKVQFNDENLVQIIEYDDDDESKQMRQLYWEIFALDRFRFKDRICKTQDALLPILNLDHRNRIYNERILPYLAKQNEEEENARLSGSITSKLDHDSKDPVESNLIDEASSSTSNDVKSGHKRRRHRNRRRKKRKSKNQT